jgi:hypothetical protein
MTLGPPPKPQRISSTSILARFPSMKNQAMIRCHSLIELNYCYVLEWDPSVIRYQNNPFKISDILYEGKKITYTPDFAVYRDVINSIVECKPERQLEDPRTKQQIFAGKTWSSHNAGWKFDLILDSALRGPKQDNIILCYRYRSYPMEISVINILFDALEKHSRIQLTQFYEILTGDMQCANSFPMICALLFQHVLETNMDQNIDRTSVIWRRTNGAI